MNKNNDINSTHGDKDSKNKITIYEQGNVEILFCNSNHDYPLHSHESWCMGVVTEGEVTFQIASEECNLKRGMFFLIPSNTGVKITPVKKFKYINISIKNELRSSLDNLKFDQFFLKLKDVDEFTDICYDFMWYGDEEALIRRLISLINPLLCLDSMKKKKEISEPVSNAIKYMKNHVNDKFDLEAIAQASYVSKYHLVRQFKKEMGVSPRQYYIQTKLRIAKADIIENQTEVEIAAELNFADQSHLCRQFKQMMGISMQEYKRNIRKK